jgi:coniferyl-aldehyde dehydrogenase
VIVAPGYPIATRGARIAAGKWLNAGQTCIAPDYLLVQSRATSTPLVAALRRPRCRARYPGSHGPGLHPRRQRRQYRAAGRLARRGRARGARIEPLIESDGRAGRKPAPDPPTLVLNPPEDTAG